MSGADVGRACHGRLLLYRGEHSRVALQGACQTRKSPSDNGITLMTLCDVPKFDVGKSTVRVALRPHLCGIERKVCPGLSWSASRFDNHRRCPRNYSVRSFVTRQT